MKNILITGVSRGLGFKIAETLLQEGYRLYGVNRTISDELQSLQKNFPQQLHLKSFDLSNTGDVKVLLLNDFLTLDTPLHGFVNNAAMAYDDIVTNINADTLEHMYRINVFTPMILTKYVIRNMLLHQIRGSIVHISSISVHTGYKGLAMYASTKGALEAFSKNTAREWGERKIRSNCIVAGFMETAMNAALSKEQKDRIYRRTSLKEATEAASVADMAAHLLSDKARSITGQNIFVDAGTI